MTHAINEGNCSKARGVTIIQLLVAVSIVAALAIGTTIGLLVGVRAATSQTPPSTEVTHSDRIEPPSLQPAKSNETAEQPEQSPPKTPEANVSAPPASDTKSEPTATSAKSRGSESEDANQQATGEADTKSVKPEKTQLAAPDKLAFQFKPDHNYEYEFELLTGTRGRGFWQASGTVTYTHDQAAGDASADLRAVRRQTFQLRRPAGGMALVVNSNGWLVTSFHVIRDAATIEVAIDGKNYPADVARIDAPHDLALLRIGAFDLTPARTPAKTPAKGDDIYIATASGSPQNTGLRMIRGRVSGIVEHEGFNWIQADAAVNPSDCGGPLLSPDGEVLGVLTSGLASPMIDRLSMSTDMEGLQSLLTAEGLRWTQCADPPAKGKEGLEAASHSIGRVSVKVTIASSDAGQRLRYTGNVKSPLRNVGPAATGVTTLGPHGEIMSVEGPSDFPLISTTAGMLAFDYLPEAGANKWHLQRTRSATLLDDAAIPGNANVRPDATARLGGVYLPQYGTIDQQPGVLYIQPNAKRISMRDELSYELTDVSDEKAVVSTQISSLWVAEPTGVATARLDGVGQYTFDRQQNVISSGFSDLKLRMGTDGIVTTLPFRYSFKLKSVLTSDEVKNRAAEKAAEAKADYQKRVAGALATLKDEASPEEQVKAALQALGGNRQLPVDAPRDEVSAALDHWLRSSDPVIRNGATRAAESWATAKNIPALMEQLQTSDIYSNTPAIIALGATGGNEKVAEMLARLIVTQNTRFSSGQALMKMGSNAETAVLPLLKSTDQNVRSEACRVLGAVGGERSQAALEELIKAAPFDRDESPAKQALEKVKVRLATKGD